MLRIVEFLERVVVVAAVLAGLVMAAWTVVLIVLNMVGTS